ncbi:MAG TPA: hypothetical protein VMI75_15745 [Polyangiaceae bacterium]|nr:hypothetical protein [Polyangiaceae bacterium]
MSRRLPFGAAGILVFVMLYGGCSSASSPAAQSCATTPTPPAQDDFCTALASYYGRCGHCSDCTEQNLQNCTKKGSAISAAYHAAFLSCTDAIPCSGLVGADPGGDPSFSTCVEQQMRSATPTAAQAAAKTAYCNACNATNANDCTNFFASTGPGYNVLLYGDAMATMATANCASSCDPLKYGVCVALLACGPTGGDYCSDGGLCAPH